MGNREVIAEIRPQEDSYTHDMIDENMRFLAEQKAKESLANEKIIEIAQDLEKSKKVNKIKFWITFSISLVALVSSIVFGIIALI